MIKPDPLPSRPVLIDRESLQARQNSALAHERAGIEVLPDATVDYVP
jgi:hypothetical protein